MKNRNLGDDKKQSITIQRMNGADLQTSKLCDDLIKCVKKKKKIKKHNEGDFILYAFFKYY